MQEAEDWTGQAWLNTASLSLRLTSSRRAIIVIVVVYLFCGLEECYEVEGRHTARTDGRHFVPNAYWPVTKHR